MKKEKKRGWGSPPYTYTCEEQSCSMKAAHKYHGKRFCRLHLDKAREYYRKHGHFPEKDPRKRGIKEVVK